VAVWDEHLSLLCVGQLRYRAAEGATTFNTMTEQGLGKSMALLSTFRNGLSAFCNGLSAFRFPPQCYVSVLSTGGEGRKVGGKRAESGKSVDVSRK
jgi:hypothetical protein